MYDDYYLTSGSSAATAGLVGAALIVPLVIVLAVSVVMIISMWKIFKKAGKNGWEAIVPIYNLITMFSIIKVNPLFILLALIPGVGFLAILVIYSIRLAQGFGKDDTYAIGLVLLSIVFLPMLAFGKDTWDANKIKLDMMSFLNDKSVATADNANPASNSETPTEGIAAPIAPAEPITPTEPVSTTVETTPAPIAPAEPVTSAEPVAPSEPITPAEPTPTAPAEPTTPAEPVAPETPADPTTPSQTL